MTKEREMPVRNRIETERCPETGRDIVWPWKLAVFSVHCSVTSMSLVHSAFSATWESATVWGEISPSLSFLFMPFQCSSRTRALRKKNVLQEKFSNVQMLGGRTQYFLTTSKHRIPLKTSNRNCSKKLYFKEHFYMQPENDKCWSPDASQLVQRQPGLWQIWKRLLFFQTL